MSFETAELTRVLRKPFELNAEPGEDVLIVTDTAIEPSVQEALMAAANTLDLDPTLAIMEPRKRDNNDPTAVVGEAIESADLAALASSKALVHSAPAASAQHAGTKILIMSELSSDILRSGAARTDYDAMQAVADRLGEIYDDAAEIRVVDDNGTDLVADIEDRNYWPIAGRVWRTETTYAAAFPDGEMGVCPAEGSTEGTVVWDTSVHDIGNLSQPIELTVEEGWVTDISGGAEAEKFERILREEGDENAFYCAAEIALGINPGAEFTGRMRTDKKVEGSVHVATGDNVDIGGSIESNLHLDGVIAAPTVYVDDRKIAEDGDVLVSPE